MAFILTLGCLFLIYIYNLCQLVGPSLKFEWNRLVSPRFEWTLKFERSPRFEGITLRSPRIECFTYFWGWSSTCWWGYYHGSLSSSLFSATHWKLGPPWCLIFKWVAVTWLKDRAPGLVFCLLLGVSSGCAQPITGQVTSVTWPVIVWA